MIRARNPDGLRLFLQLHGDRINAVLAKRVGDAMAEAAMAAAAFILWQRHERFDAQCGSLAAWFTTVAMNVARSIWRADRRWLDRHGPLDVDRFLPAAPADPEDSQEQKSAIPAAYLADLRRVIAGLPGLQRATMEAELTNGDRPSAADLARKFDTTPNAIYVSRNRAKAQVRRELELLGWPKGQWRR